MRCVLNVFASNLPADSNEAINNVKE